jgi:hypothetical protein
MDMTASILDEQFEKLMQLPMAAPAMPAGAARHYLVDFGREVVGWITLEVEAPAGAVIDLLGCEGMQDDRLVPTQRMNNTLRYVCREGRQSYTSCHRRGLRYLKVAVHSTSAPVVIESVTVRLATYPPSTTSSFRCADPRLTALWETCVYTVRLCTEDTFTDCPAYEQVLWTGDAFSDALVHYAVHGDPRIVERCLRLIAASLARLPLVNAQVPGDWEHDPIPNWSWLWVLGCREHYRFTADRDFAQEIYPALAQQADFLDGTRRRNEYGLFELRPAWHFLDWSSLDEGPNYLMAHENMLAIAALCATAELAEVVGNSADAARWRHTADDLRAAVNEVFWSEDAQAYVDSVHDDGTLSSVVSQPTNVLALYCEVATGARAEAISRGVARLPAGWIRTGSPWMFSFNLLVLAREKRHAAMLALIRDRWGEMLDRGATTTWETFAGYEPGGLWTRSWCHAWSATPAYLLSAHVLGIRPLTPGFTRALIAPELCDLAWVRGSMPTPRGEIAVHAERRGAGLRLQITLPPGVTADVHLHATEQAAAPRLSGMEGVAARDGDLFIVSLPAGAQGVIEI